MEQGLVQIYTGKGKGKTTAAMGLAIRAAGNGLKVKIVQFFKGTPTGEIELITKIIPQIEIIRFNNQNKTVWTMKDDEKEKLREETIEGFKIAGEISKSSDCDLLIMDEIFGTINRGFIQEKDLAELIKNKSKNIELVLTGRNAGEKIIELADLVTEMNKIKHPIDQGIKARKGIER